MATAAGIANVQSYFRITPEDMPKLSTETTKPNYTTIKKFTEALEQNAMSVPSAQTELGHLALVISDADYTIANEGNAWIPPTNPGKAPTNPVPTATTTEITTTPVRNTRSSTSTTTTVDPQAISMLPFTAAEAIRAFNEEKQEYQKYMHTRTALRNLILNAVDDKYICKLKKPRTHYALVDPYNLVEHLQTTYGTVDDHDRTANEERMKKEWDTNQPIEIVFEQLRDGQEFAKAGGEHISDDQLVRWGYNIISDTQLFDSECKKWRQKPTADRRWAKFVDYFTTADDDRRKSRTQEPETTGEVYTANQVQEILQSEIAAVLAQLKPDKENTPPTEQANATQGINANEIKNMIKEALKDQTNNKEYRGGRKNQYSKKKELPAQAIVDGYPVSYCWSHGVTRNLNHASHSCSRKKEGHKDAATYDNRMGGSDEVQKPRN